VADADQHLIDYEKRIKSAVWPVVLWCVLSVVVVFFPSTGWLRPSADHVEVWFARGGAPVTIFALIAQTRVTRLADVLTPGHFGHAGFNGLRDKYRLWKIGGNAVALVMTVVGTVMWAYGDLLWGWL